MERHFPCCSLKTKAAPCARPGQLRLLAVSEAVGYEKECREASPAPDVNMPVMNGFEFLEAYDQLPFTSKRRSSLCLEGLNMTEKLLTTLNGEALSLLLAKDESSALRTAWPASSFGGQ